MKNTNFGFGWFVSCFWTVFALVGMASAMPFSLTDSDPASPEFRKNYLGSYGINAAIEPALEREDRGVYEEVLPYLSDNPAEAIRILENAIEPDCNAAFNFLLGSLYYMEDKLDDSKKQLEVAIVKHPTFRRAHRTIALIYARNEDVPNAIQHLLKVIELGGGDGQSYGMLGYAYLNEQKYRSALGAYQNARVFAPDSYDYKRGQAQCLLNTNQYEQAIALYNELIADDPSESEFWLLQANAFLALDRREETAANLEMARSLGNEDFSNLSLLANIYLQQGAIGIGVDVASRALQFAEPKNVDYALRQLDYLVSRGFAAEADRVIVAFEEWLEPKLGEHDTQAFSARRALVDFRLGREAIGLDRLEKILEVDPLNGEALIMLGERYQEKDMYSDAEYYYGRALSVENSKRKALLALGKMEVSRGNFGEARKHLSKALDLKFESNIKKYLDQVEEAWRNTRQS
ncbi:tetratricopeptide repeat protein [Puniceicoccaceae bacterium K14]|nr:tetratricopeptide repeat protein [Puniceicoccaceae bacterium K14]